MCLESKQVDRVLPAIHMFMHRAHKRGLLQLSALPSIPILLCLITIKKKNEFLKEKLIRAANVAQEAYPQTSSRK